MVVWSFDRHVNYSGSSPNSNLAAVQVASFLTSDFLFQLEPLPLPPRYAPQHLLHFSIEAREAHCRFVRSVAVGAGAVDDEGNAGGECGEVALDDSAGGQVD